jgi:serine phosphatase RsbU (regulator of sigma subunit)
MVVVGDVTGHGADAARLTAVARFALRAVAELTGDPVAAIGQLNRMLLTEPQLSPVTLVCVLLSPLAEGAVAAQVTCCGHPRPLLVAADGVTEVGQASPIVGAFAELTWRSTRVVVRPGETLVLYTDGVTDTRGREELFGPERLQAALLEAPESLSGLVDHVIRAVHDYRIGAQSDDEAVLALRLEPTQVPVAGVPIAAVPFV